jgi:uncharacterized SAM-binding protein YcdF (DUF218 family)
MIRGLIKLILSLASIVVVAECVIQVLILIDYTGDKAEKADVAWVLGASLNDDGEVEGSLKTRLDKAVELYKYGYAPRLIVSGGRKVGQLIPEAHAMKTYLVQNGVPEDAIITEETALNTWENLERCGAITKDQGYGSVLVVTSDFHIARTKWMLKDQGYENALVVAAESPKNWATKIANHLQESVSVVKYGYNKLKGSL